MQRKAHFIYLNLSGVIFLFALVYFQAFIKRDKVPQENHSPAVKIISPKNTGSFAWNTPINYEISVADKEDGDSKYDEINAKEVLLEVRYVASKEKMQAILNKGAQNDALGLAVIRASNCFNCHNFNSKSIGPSFDDIVKRYPATKPNIDSMVKRIRQGSSGIWVKEKMPTHPELSVEETKSAVQWILKNGGAGNVDYYTGLQGSFRIKPPAAANKDGIYVLTASYTDHGLKEALGKRLKGQDMVVIYGK